MSGYKCPACGLKDTIKILYGEPTYEAYLASERGEFILGGCCFSDISPTKHCKSCGQNFGNKDIFYLLGMASFEFSVGGYFGTSHFIYINCKRKNKLIRYAKTPSGMYVDLKHPQSEINFQPDILIKEIPLTSEQWLKFIKELNSLEIDNWKDEYIDREICDGTQWEIIIRFPKGDKIKKYGSNEYPPYWSKFMKTMNAYIGEDIN